MNIPGIERETVITYNEQEKATVVYTCNQRSNASWKV